MPGRTLDRGSGRGTLLCKLRDGHVPTRRTWTIHESFLSVLNAQTREAAIVTRGVTINRYRSIYRYNVWRYNASMPRVKYRYLSYKKAPLFWHVPHFHIMSVYALPPTRAFSFNLTYQDSIKGLPEGTRRAYKMLGIVGGTQTTLREN